MSQLSSARIFETDDEVRRARQDFADSLLGGLRRDERSIPSRFLYDARGSELFEDITRLEEYYPTRTERTILEAHGRDMAANTPAGSALVEFGSGSSLKTEILLRELDKLAAYVAIDISGDALVNAVERLGRAFPKLRVHPVVADFSKQVALPCDVLDRHKLGFFPGSTIGNFMPLQAICLLANMSRTLGEKSRLIIGVDLKKDRDTLLQAYDDSAGVTAQFNFNLLARANTELGADFDISCFGYEATYDEPHGRVDMYLVSRKAQSVQVNGERFLFGAGERIHTEYSHKYSQESFSSMAEQAGWKTRTVWSDDNKLFSVFELVN